MNERTTIMQTRLYKASLNGSVPELERLEEEDPLILDRVSLMTMNFHHQTPLHIAVLRGHSDFTTAILSRKPRLAAELDLTRCSPLHLASATGHVEIVRALLNANDAVCKARDEDGRTPLYLAVMNGRVEVVKLLIQARPESIREKLGRRGGGGDTVLHLCVKYNRLEVLKTLVDGLLNPNDVAFLNSADEDGNTLLHLAAALKQLDTIEYLLQVQSVKEHPNTNNKNNSTALDVVEQCPNRDLKHMEIRELLLQAGVRRARDLETPLPTLPDNNNDNNNPQTPLNLCKSISRYWNKYFDVDQGWFREVRGHLITASTLTTGSVWQDGPQGNGNQTMNDSSHKPGTSILADNDGSYPTFLFVNTFSLLASMSTLLLALSGFPSTNKVLLWLLIFTMLCTITSMTFSYLLILGMTSPSKTWGYVSFNSSLFYWFAICTFVFTLHVSRLFTWLGLKYKELVQNRRSTRQPNENWLWRKFQELVQNKWPTRQPNENNVNLMTQPDTTITGTLSISI
ncbi:Ankyrin repeat-containing protein BDA1 [Camellia lanceoleosa]|uniref:Ankyrin repeat-containing protein BDA1 n=1 Tax=Camellia lanceoleosa TaxID=1840588 RepID=A0ACC0FBR7_9ERIC|nr:Ankyrin repeat-containing protein BDA1 [Camellia lanceoleosa]